MYTIYHNPRCRKSRVALQYLKDHGKQIKVVNYLKEPLSKSTLKEILAQIELQPSQLLRRNEADWKAIENRNKLTEDQLLDVLVNYPITIERPIVISATSGVLARPLENLISFLNSN
jgi:arsenate reductase